MNSKFFLTIQELQTKIPFSVLGLGYLLYLGFLYYDFTSSPESILNQKKASLVSMREQLKIEQAKFAQVSEFYKTLEIQKSKLRGLTIQLAELKGSLSEESDIESYLKLPLTEANRVGLKITGRKSNSPQEQEQFVEQSHELTYRGAFVQLLSFFEKLTTLPKIVRVEGLSAKPVATMRGSVPELEGKITIKTYNYKMTNADSVNTKTTEVPPVMPVTSSVGTEDTSGGSTAPTENPVAGAAQEAKPNQDQAGGESQ